MRRLLAFTTVVLIASSAGALADDWLGVCADEAGTVHELHILPWEMVTAYFIAHVPSTSTGVTELELSIPNLPVHMGDVGILSIDWSGELFIGDIYTGLAMAWTDPVFPDENDNLIFGEATFLSLDSSWPGDNIPLEVFGFGGDPFPIFTDGNFIAYEAFGYTCWINSDIVSSRPSSYSAIRLLF